MLTIPNPIELLLVLVFRPERNSRAAERAIITTTNNNCAKWTLNLCWERKKAMFKTFDSVDIFEQCEV
jgi:hypothetical protein